MSRTMNLATVNGTREVSLLTTFSSQVGGHLFTFGIHLDVFREHHFKVSEFSTGMGIAAVCDGNDVPTLCTDGLPSDIVLELAQRAVQGVIENHGEDEVTAILLANRAERPILNLAA